MSIYSHNIKHLDYKSIKDQNNLLSESVDKSSLDANFKKKDKIKLSNLRMESRQRNDEGKSLVLSWYNDKEFVATVLVDTIPASDGYKWFGSFRVSKKYRGSGLGDQIMDLIISSKYKAGALSVYKDNEVAINLYRKHGFKISKERTNKDYYFMYLDKNKMDIDSIKESYIINEPDILYNKDKFDSGEINLCFVTGHSGSGKSTLAHSKEKENSKVEAYELDDLQCIADYFTMDNLKEYGDLIYSYFNGEGKKFYTTYKELIDNKIPGTEYEDKLYPGFVHYAMKYAKAHKDRKFIVEGVWLFGSDDNGKPWFNPEEFKPYAFYIKGTSMIISKLRGAKRDAKEDSKGNKKEEKSAFRNNFFKKNWKWYFVDEKRINIFRDYFKKLVKNNSINESADIDISFNSPKELSDWMKKNIKYKEFTKLMSAEEVYAAEGGSCHDQAEFENYMFNIMNIKHGRIFFIEYNKDSNQGGMTHTFLYYKEKNKFYWFENAWGGQEGIHGPYNSIAEMKDKVKELHMKNSKFDDIEFANVKNIKPGMNLQEYVDACLT